MGAEDMIQYWDGSNEDFDKTVKANLSTYSQALQVKACAGHKRFFFQKTCHLSTSLQTCKPSEL